MLTLAAANTLQGVCGTGTALTYTVTGMELVGTTETYKVLAQGQLPTSVAALYTVPSSTTAFVKMILIANATGSAVSGLILYVNGTAAANQILSSLTIPANGCLTFDANGWKLYDSNGELMLSGSNIFDATAPSATTPLALGTAGSATVAARRDHTHQSPGGLASITAASSAISNTETQVVGATIPANFMQVGTTFRVMAAGVGTSGGTAAVTGTFRIRIGTTTLTGNIATSVAPVFALSKTSFPFFLDAILTVRIAGASGAIIGDVIVWTDSTSLLFATANTLSTTAGTVVVDTTAQKILELTFISSNSGDSLTFHIAEIEVVKM